MSFGEILKKIRLKNKDTLRGLASKINFSHVYISQVEKSERPAGKNIFTKLIEIYPEDEKELTHAYLEEVLPDGIVKKVLNDNKALLEKGNDEALLNYLMDSDIK